MATVHSPHWRAELDTTVRTYGGREVQPPGGVWYRATAMLTRLHVKGFRLLRDVDIEFPSGVPLVLIGPNAAGKSTVLEVLDFLSSAVRDGLSEAVNRDRGGFDLIRSAGFREPLEIEVAFTVGADVPAPFGDSAFEYQAHIDGAIGGGYRLVHEHVVQMPFGNPASRDVLLQMASQGGRAFNVTTGQSDEIHQEAWVEPILRLVRHDTFYPYLSLVTRVLAGIRIYPGFYVLPQWARDARETIHGPRDAAVVGPTAGLDRRGFELVKVLYDLQTNHEPEWAELLAAFRAEYPTVKKIEFPADAGGGRIALAVRDERFGRLTAWQMSEGMVAFLSLLAATLTPTPPAAIAFDEPDAHFHPSLIKRLAWLLERAAERTTVVVATHSDRLLDHLSDPAASVKTVEAGPNGTVLRSLDPEALRAWRERYSLSDLRARGQIDAANTDAGKR
ncbi:MAG: AAA family ATPase [Deltaproteobacteria bacterium]|nr:AAA family ATPase [Deltaproteobacteria bacterium]